MKNNTMIKKLLSIFILIWGIGFAESAEREDVNVPGQRTSRLQDVNSTSAASPAPLALASSSGEATQRLQILLPGKEEKGVEKDKTPTAPSSGTSELPIASQTLLSLLGSSFDVAKESQNIAKMKPEELDPKHIVLLLKAAEQLIVDQQREIINFRQASVAQNSKIVELEASLTAVKVTQQKIFDHLGDLIFDKKVVLRDYIATNKILWGMLGYSGFRFIINATLAYAAAGSNMYGFVIFFAILTGIETGVDAAIRAYYVGTVVASLGTISPLIPKPTITKKNETTNTNES